MTQVKSARQTIQSIIKCLYEFVTFGSFCRHSFSHWATRLAK